jgi:tRNA CCA-adding enzyme
MKKKLGGMLKEVLEGARLKEKDIASVKSSLDGLFLRIRERAKKSGLDVGIVAGGSFAKNTMIKKDVFDVDIFLKFGKKHRDISDLAEKLLGGLKKKRVHGSRDYFRIRAKNNVIIEVIPVVKIKRPDEAENITDLSLFHVNYVRKFPRKILDEIILAKAFCYASKCYGAESYINGFSGYALELLVYNYGSFLGFLRAMGRIDAKGKKVIDIEKRFRSGSEAMMDINSAKLQSPIILIDPTCKERNALAALSTGTFLRFQKACRDFLRNPSSKLFEKKPVDFKKMEKAWKGKGLDFVLLKAATNRQEGDIAGSKLLKFQDHLSGEIEKYFQIKAEEFSYESGNSAIYAFAAKRRGEIIHRGPKASDKTNAERFKKRRKSTFVKSGRVYSKEKVNLSLEEFLKRWKGKNKDRMKQMHVESLEMV